MGVPVIRRAHHDDAAALALVGAASFLESYAHFIGVADMLAYVGEKSSEAAYRGFAGDSECALWIVEMPGTRAPLGYALLTPPDLPIDLDDADIELRRIYILARWQGEGLGRGLMDVALAEGRRRRKRRLLIGVYSGNERAIGFYRRMGAVPVGARRFRVGGAQFDDLILAIEL